MFDRNKANFMKTTLISITILIVLIVFFSTIPYEVTLREYSPAELEYPFGNWAFPGNSGDPILGEGGSGTLNVFTLGNPNGNSQPAPAQGENISNSQSSIPIQSMQVGPGTAESEEIPDYSPISVEVIDETRAKTRDNLEPINRVFYWIINVLVVINVAAVALLVIQRIEMKRKGVPLY